MAGSMSLADLVADLKTSLHDAAQMFLAAADADYQRHLALAALAISERRRLTALASITLVADQIAYSAPADLWLVKSHLWGVTPIPRCQPWERGWPGPLPRLRLALVDNVNKLLVEPVPTAAQIAVLGAEMKFYYYQRHVIGALAADTTVNAGDRGLLLLRAQAEACRELAIRGMTKPLALRDGLSAAPRNSTPAALYAALLAEFDERMCA